MRRLAWLGVLGTFLGGAYFSAAQNTQPQTGPNIPIFQPTAPQFNLRPGVNNVPGSAVFVPATRRAPRPVVIYRYPNDGLFGQAGGGFTGSAAGGTTNYYSIMGGMAGTAAQQQTIFPAPNATGWSPTGAPWQFPSNNTAPPQFPTLRNQAPIVGQSNGWFGDPKQPAEVQPQGNFGIDIVPGINRK